MWFGRSNDRFYPWIVYRLPRMWLSSIAETTNGTCLFRFCRCILDRGLLGISGAVSCSMPSLGVGVSVLLQCVAVMGFNPLQEQNFFRNFYSVLVPRYLVFFSLKEITTLKVSDKTLLSTPGPCGSNMRQIILAYTDRLCAGMKKGGTHVFEWGSFTSVCLFEHQQGFGKFLVSDSEYRS